MAERRSTPAVRVLVAGHLPARAADLADRVARLGARLEPCSDPEEALSRLSAGGPTVVVIAPTLPGRQALEIGIRVRRTPGSGQVALLLWAGTLDPELEIRAYQEGIDTVLPPGASSTEISARIQGQLRRLLPETARSHGSAGEAPASADPDAPDVVVVEDDSGMLEMLRYTLKGHGYRVATFRDGPRALDELRKLPTGGRRPVVLLDVDLPGLDGFRLLQELTEARPGDYQIVLCTVHRSEAAQVLGLQSGAVDYLVKPLQMPVVLAKVDRLIALSAHR